MSSNNNNNNTITNNNHDTSIISNLHHDDSYSSTKHTNNTNNPIIKRQKRKILSEEEYTTTLQSIITRDYYPAIPSLQRDLSVLQKRSENDTASAIAIRRAARKLESMEEELDLKEQEEERHALLHNGGIRERPRPLDRESIDGFHARVTSEDNAYFETNMIREGKERRERLDIVYGANTTLGKGHVQKLLQNYGENGDSFNNSQQQRLLYDESPFMTASDQFNEPFQRIQAAGTDKDGKSKSDRNSLFFTPQHCNPNTTIASTTTNTTTTDALSDHSASHQQQLIALDSNSSSDNQLMPPPPSRKYGKETNTVITMPIATSKQQQQEVNNDKLHLVEYQAKPQHRNLISSLQPTNEKQIIPQNTRFEYQNKTRIIGSSLSSYQTTTSNHHHSKSQNIDFYETDSSSMSTDLDAPLRPIHIERQARMNQIQKDRNTLVAMTPTIIPGVGSKREKKRGDNDDFDEESDNDESCDNGSPIVTWGRIGSTPLVASGEQLRQEQHWNIDTDSTTDKSFALPSVDTRENIARKVEAKLARQKQRYEEAGEVNTKRRSKNSTNANIVSSSSLMERQQSLTPAARSLLNKSNSKFTSSFSREKTSSIKINARSNSALGSVLRASYTPKRPKNLSSSRSSSTTSKTRDLSFLHKATPLLSKAGDSHRDIMIQREDVDNNSTDKNNKGASLTSGLLNF